MSLWAVLVTGLLAGVASCAAVQGGLLAGVVAPPPPSTAGLDRHETPNPFGTAAPLGWRGRRPGRLVPRRQARHPHAAGRAARPARRRRATRRHHPGLDPDRSRRPDGPARPGPVRSPRRTPRATHPTSSLDTTGPPQRPLVLGVRARRAVRRHDPDPLRRHPRHGVPRNRCRIAAGRHRHHGDLRHRHLLRGCWVLVNYFATWCVPCRQEHPDLVRFHERHQAVGDLEVIGVVYSDSLDAVRDFCRDNGGTWPMAEDPNGTIALDWGVAGVPESFLVNPRGIVVAKLLGGVTEAQLEELLAEATSAR